MDKELEKAKAYAYKLLSYRARTGGEIRKKLAEKEYSPDIIHQVLDFLLEYGLINDTEFARSWIRNRSNLKPMGKRRLKQELLQKSIKAEIIESELTAITEEEEYLLALELARKRAARSSTPGIEKIGAFLERRGFSYQIIKRVLGSMWTTWHTAPKPLQLLVGETRIRTIYH